MINLSAIRDEVWIIEKHFIDSIIIFKYFDLKGKILDIWSWWGFPWIPLKIMRDDLDITLLDSIWKKVDSMNFFIKNLWLEWIIAIKDRAEDLAKNKDYIESFDYIVSRATAYLPKIVEWASPFLKSDWKIILYKLYNEEEINDGIKIINKFNLKILKIEKYIIWDQERIFIMIWK
ncbi:MAG: Ribosomal RNA small subunit methyltransferase G [uncultured bacterium (gcode 4)]|uniref:Ribosomal RNA small subunit methyltransferase G n=1 Tax=uncultured bacterium (gcode 4) TaxID=1234023 RepID=K2FYP9_9BACT|nr:MAG: Ribosomal RNA small subunit methyltransferase G [uncultured bacterium (gcode 4)]